MYDGYLGVDFGREFGDLWEADCQGLVGSTTPLAHGVVCFCSFLAFGLRGQPAKLYFPVSWVVEIPSNVHGRTATVWLLFI